MWMVYVSYNVKHHTACWNKTKKLGHVFHVWVGRDVRYEIVRLICLVVEKLLLVAKATNINFSSRAGGGCKGLTWPFTSRDPLTSCDPPYATPSLYATRPLTPHGPLTLRVTPPIYATRSPYVVNPYHTPNESLWTYTPENKWISAAWRAPKTSASSCLAADCAIPAWLP